MNNPIKITANIALCWTDQGFKAVRCSIFEILPKNRFMGHGFTIIQANIANTNTKSLAKEFSKILIFEYFEDLMILIGLDVFFDADSELPRIT